MKKLILVISVIILFLLLAQTSVFAGECRNSTPDFFLNIYKFDRSPAAGLKHHVAKNIFATGNIEYRSSTGDLELQVGAAYLLPYKVLFFRFYGGSGIQVSRNKGYQYPYLVMGTSFIVFFSEVLHPLQNRMEPRFRGGFSFKF